MGKYLHHYTSESDFQTDYNDEGGIKSFVCSAGTFTYDRYEEVQVGVAHFWKNGDKELVTPWRAPKVGAWDYDTGTGAWDNDNEIGVDITAVGEEEPGKYIEPWVSYTTDIRTDTFKGTLTQLHGTPEVTLEYAGECNWEYDEYQ